MSLAHDLARRGDAEALRRLIQGALDPTALVNEVDDGGYTPLFHGVRAQNPNLEAVRVLLEAGANPSYVRVERLERPSGEWMEDLAEIDEELGLGLPPGFFDSLPSEHRESLLAEAIKGGSLEIVRLLEEHGADLSYEDPHGYTAVLNAVYGKASPELLRYLLDLGIDPNVRSSYGEIPIGVAYGRGALEQVGLLLGAGADPSPLGWTPLHRAVALGTADDVLRELDRGAQIDAFDEFHRTALHVAVIKGDWGLAESLLAAGADPNRKADGGESALAHAVLGGHPELVPRLLAMGAGKEDMDAALRIAVEQGDPSSVRMLLEAGADADQRSDYSTLLEDAVDGETVRLLLEHGADPANLKAEGRRLLLGLPDRDEDALNAVSREEYLEFRYPREGTSNPEEMSDPFRLAMIRSGWCAYWAREQFDDPATFVCGPVEARPPAVWCFERFGQSTTILPDGRIVLIAGEHEDGYDPDFCIYNDVAVFEPGGAVRVYGYPYAVFPPTDFHSATLVGEWIYVLGSLGYRGRRQGPMPAWRLSTKDLHMEALETTGERPGRIYEHRATLVDGRAIRIEGGRLLSFEQGDSKAGGIEETFAPNPDAFDLDLQTLAWSRR